MPLKLLPMSRADLYYYEEIVVAGFSHSLMRVFHPAGITSEAKAQAVATAQRQVQLSEDTAKAAGHEPSLHFMKVVDTDLEDVTPADPFGSIVGVAKWNVYPRGRTESEIEAEEVAATPPSSEPPPPGFNTAAWAAFKAALISTKRDLFGTRPFLILEVLVTLPHHHRRGIGAMHLAWGCQMANALGIPMYLEASLMGRPLYEKWGYKAVRDIPFDARDFGADEPMTHYAMIRPAKAIEAEAVDETVPFGLQTKQTNGHVVANGSVASGISANGHA